MDAAQSQTKTWPRTKNTLESIDEVVFATHARQSRAARRQHVRTNQSAAEARSSQREGITQAGVRRGVRGTFVIGVIALTQISHFNGATESIYMQGPVASRAATCCARAGRRKMLLTASTQKGREELDNQIEQALANIDKEQAQLVKFADQTDEAAIAQQKSFSQALAKWSADLRTFVKLVKEQPLDLSQMNWQVCIQDVSLLVETGKLEKRVDELVARRGAAVKATIETAAFSLFSIRPS